MTKVTSVDEYVERHSKWRPLLELFREVMLSTELEENIKWGAPYYSLDGKNVVGFVAFKNHAALWFTNGVFLDDPDQLLINAQEGKTKAGRQLRFHSNEEADIAVIRDFVQQAIKNQKAGKEHVPEKNQELVLPEELKAALQEHEELEGKFSSLTPYKQKEFAEYISEAKRSSTKDSRLKKILPMIKNGIGLHDKYR